MTTVPMDPELKKIYDIVYSRPQLVVIAEVQSILRPSFSRQLQTKDSVTFDSPKLLADGVAAIQDEWERCHSPSVVIIDGIDKIHSEKAYRSRESELRAIEADLRRWQRLDSLSLIVTVNARSNMLIAQQADLVLRARKEADGLTSVEVWKSRFMASADWPRAQIQAVEAELREQDE